MKVLFNLARPPFAISGVLLGLLSFWLPAANCEFAKLQSTTINSTESQDEVSEKNWWLERRAIERLYADDLQELSNRLRSDGDSQAARAVLELYKKRDPQRQYIFLPVEVTAEVPATAQALGLQEIRKEHAKRIFELAKKAAAMGAGGAAFQYLHEVLYFDSEHEAVRRILGHRKIETGWRVAPERMKVKRATKPQKDMGWAKGTYYRVTTAHFEIDSMASEEETVALAEKLERWFGVWRQVFFEFWSTSEQVDRWIRGGGNLRNSTRKHRVVFFPDKAAYAEQLEPKIKGISASSGYYSDQWKTSFFYAGEETTWRHELTHQLFQESRKANLGAFNEGYLWLGEGIAMYLESLCDFDDYVTLGGFDAQRLQYARLRLFRERFFVKLDQLSEMSMREFQSSPDRRRLYSQSAGMCHYLMTGENGDHRDKLIEFLKLIYRGKLRADSFEKITGLSNENFQNGYFDFLKTRNESIERHLTKPLSRTEFSLGSASISSDAMEEIGRCHNLELLDLSENQIEIKDLEVLRDCDRLEELYLSNCRIARGALSELSELENLLELDLTASDCSDEEFLKLAACKNLKSVTIKATKISESAIARLQSELPNLNIER